MLGKNTTRINKDKRREGRRKEGRAGGNEKRKEKSVKKLEKHEWKEGAYQGRK